MSWKKIKISEIGEVVTGKTPPTKDTDNYGGIIPFITPSDMNGDRKIFSTERYISERGKATVKKCVLPPKTICVSCIGSDMGKVVITTEESITNQQINSIKCYDGYDYNFIYYLLLTQNKKIKSLGKNATAVPILNKSKFSDLEVIVPDYSIQKKISNILKTYDDLIENNQKQIKLLEEEAQRLYKEWFVDLHFPGYEDVAIVDGVPEGWELLPLSEIIGYEIGGGWGEESATEKCDKPAYVIRGADLYGITHGVISEVPYRFHATSNLQSRQLIDGDIIFEVSGGSKMEGVARTTLIRNTILQFLREPVMCASFCKLVRTKEKTHVQLLFDTFQYMRASGKTREYDKKSASSIVNYRWKDFLAQENILIPNDDLLLKYNALSENIYQLILKKSVDIEKAKEARDRLLPKLMSGEIEV